jgi:hypothetical protein
VPLTEEATHLPELVSVLLVWLLTVPAPGRRVTDAPATGGGAPALRVVRGDEAGTGDRAAG